MPVDRRTTVRWVSIAWRRVTVLLACLGLAAVSLAAAGGAPAKDPGPSVVAAAKLHLKQPYAWGGVGPTTWDCSGFTSTLWRTVGGVTAIPRTARLQQAWAVPLPAEQVRPGDLVFFGDPVTHVGIVESAATTRAGTVVQMIDASSARKGIVERPVWTTGTIRYGRVPRPGMVPVQPWTPKAPVVTPTPTPAPPPAPPVFTPLARGLGLLLGLPARSLPSSAVAARAAARAQAYLGTTKVTDVDLVRAAWHDAGGGPLPGTRDRIAALGSPVAVGDARVGDLVVYGPPASHIGIYVGNGFMVDGSRSLGKVVIRRVWAAPSVHLLRLQR